MYFKKKNGAYWVWSSLKASLDCMPQYKFKTEQEAIDLCKCHYFNPTYGNLFLWAKNINTSLL